MPKHKTYKKIYKEDFPIHTTGEFKNCIDYSYDITNKYVPQRQNKSMQPMNYTNKTINRYFANERIYGNYT